MIRLYPDAKINLGLDITGKRPDGYHLLETVMVHTDWTDTLELSRSEAQTELITEGRPVNCPPEKNLVMKAFRLLDGEVGGLPPTLIRLRKNIPDGAGLGGGSADAAYTLRGLNELYELGIGREALAAMAARLGADCPFFIYDSPMLCTGIGTELHPIELPVDFGDYTLAIVKPDESVSTAEAYAGVAPEQPLIPLVDRIGRSVDRWQGEVVNVFERTVIPRRPRIGAIKASLIEMGAVYASMSGSGSALYALFPPTDADILADLLGKRFPDCAIHVGRTLR